MKNLVSKLMARLNKAEKDVVRLQKEVEELKNENAELWNDWMGMSHWYNAREDKAAKLWEELNRPAIEESVRKHEEEYRAWCEEVSNRYRFELEDEDLIAAYEDEFFDENSYETHEEATEGWSNLDRTHGCTLNLRNHSWILCAAKTDAYKRYKETNDEKYLHLWKTFNDMHDECLHIDPENYGGFYR